MNLKITVNYLKKYKIKIALKMSNKFIEKRKQIATLRQKTESNFFYYVRKCQQLRKDAKYRTKNSRKSSKISRRNTNKLYSK